LTTELFNISIIIPSHNRREQLAKALNHIAAMDYPSELVEVVGVLDGCTDGSGRMLETLCHTFPFKLRWLEQAQGGPAAARNAGVLSARSEYILFLDDDVMATPNLLKEHCRVHLENPQTVVVGTMSRPSDSQGPVWVRWEEHLLEKQYSDILNGKYQFTPRQFYTGNCSLKKAWIIEAGMFDETFKRFEDVELAYRLHRLNLSFQFDPAAVAYHYPNRSFKSWVNMHYLYGRYAVKIDRDKGLLDMISISRREFEQYNPITRFLAKRLLNHKILQRFLSTSFKYIAQFCSSIGQSRVGYRLLSGIANIYYYQGFNDELNASSLQHCDTAG
jgi:GT2 family glycosyltransferase